MVELSNEWVFIQSGLNCVTNGTKCEQAKIVCWICLFSKQLMVK